MTRWATLIAALLAASSAEAQCLGFQCPPGVLGAGTSGAPLPLDSFTTPSGAYSFRKLKSTYSGPAIRIRRASDNLETDINFLGCTGFTGCPWDAAAANAHCASTTCFGRAWYDQSGVARDLVQTTAANQPQLIFNCLGSLPCWQFTAATQILQSVAAIAPAGPVTMSAVANRSVGTTGGCAWMRMNGSGTNRLTTNAAPNGWVIAPTVLLATAADAAWHAGLGILHATAGQSVLNIDGTEVTGSTAPVATSGTTAVLGAATTTCLLGEAIFWGAYAVAPGERATLVNNQRSFWGF
jgi:hypothetical protein